MSEINWESESSEMIESACIYDEIDAKLQKIMVQTYNRLLDNAISMMQFTQFPTKSIGRHPSGSATDHFSTIMKKHGIKQIKNPQKIEGFSLVKDPRFGWGPNNCKYYMLVPDNVALKCKVLGHLG